MPNTVIGLYRSDSEVQRVVDDLARHDFPRQRIARHENADARLRDWLAEQGVPDREVEEYVEGVRQGGRLVTLEADDDRTREAVEIMRRHEDAGADVATDRAASDRAAGTAGAQAGPKPQAEGERGGRTAERDEERLEVTEEELDVGKREVERGGVRVRTFVTERPVEEDVRVRDETVHVDRRPADRPLSDSEADDAFRERSVEMTERDEEVVADKRARVIEEVVLSKDVEERTETVSDTVRRTDVEVEGDDAARRRFDRDRDAFRTHHRDTFADSEYGYEQYEPAYRYGDSLAHHPDYRDRDWSEVSPAARERWEERNPDTWREFEPAARHAYERALGRGRS